MWKAISISAFLIISVMLISGCGEHKSVPTSPQGEGVALTLKYQSYASIEGRDYDCICLTMDDNELNHCDLGESSHSVSNGTYAWKLFAVGNTQKYAAYYQIAAGTVTLDRNMSCVIDGNTVTWR